MRIYCWFAVAASGLSLAACSPTGQPELQANLSADGTPQAGASAGMTAGGLFGTYPPPRAQVAEAEQVIASTFTPPKKTPLPIARPDFGDRVEVAAAPATPAQPAEATPGLVTAFAAPEQPALVAAPAQPASTSAAVEPAAQTRSIAAYEREEAGIPADDKGPARTTFAATPVSFSGPAPTAGSSSNGVPFAGNTSTSFGNQRWYAAYPNVQTDCFPAELRNALDTIARHYNRPVEVTSGMRNRGRRHSMHRFCKAADIRVAGVSPSALATFAKSVPGINGVGTYRWVAVTHIDTRAERFAWRY